MHFWGAPPMALYAVLVAAWLVVAVRTLRDFRLLTR